jgi:hypothetical protein
MYQQIMVDKPKVEVFNVPTLNQEADMKLYAIKEDFGYDGAVLKGVFVSKEKAEAAVAGLKSYAEKVEVVEFEEGEVLGDGW